MPLYVVFAEKDGITTTTFVRADNHLHAEALWREDEGEFAVPTCTIYQVPYARGPIGVIEPMDMTEKKWQVTINDPDRFYVKERLTDAPKAGSRRQYGRVTRQ